MTKRFHKHKLLLDENFPVRTHFPKLNKRHNVKHITTDLNLSSLPDPKVYKLAKKDARILVTYNIKDFSPLVGLNDKTGVIGVSPNLPVEQIDKKLTALLNKSTRKSLIGKVTVITGETEL